MNTTFFSGELSVENNHTGKHFPKKMTGLPPINNMLCTKDKVVEKVSNMKRSISLENLHMKKSVSLENMNHFKKTPSLEYLKRFASSEKLDSLKNSVSLEKTNFKKSVSLTDLNDTTFDYVEKLKESTTKLIKLNTPNMLYDVAKDTLYDIAKTNLVNVSDTEEHIPNVKQLFIDHITHDSVINTMHTVQNIITHHHL
jgi:hypothetical protein